MPYNTKGLLTDTVAKPIPQYFNPDTDNYEPLYGRNGAMRVELYDASGNPITMTSGKLAVRASEIESILGEVSSTPTANTLADRLKQIADRLGEVAANPTANTALARLKTIEGYLDGLESALGTQSDAEATGNGSIIGILKRLRTLMDSAAKHTYETQSGSLVTTVPAGATIVVTQVDQACDLESLSMGTDYSFMTLRVENRRADGTYEQGMRLVDPSGQWTNPVRPKDLQDLGGENDFWREFVYDDDSNKFALGMKRQSKFGAGIRIRIYNQDTLGHNAAVTWMISVFRS